MPRGGGSRGGGGFGGFRGGRSASPPPRAAVRPAPARRPPPPPPPPAAQPQQKQGLFGGGGLGSTIATGMAFGAGSQVAHQAVRSVMGGGSGHGAPAQGSSQQQASPATYQSEAPPASYDNQYAAPAPAQFENPCISHNTNLFQCLKQNSSEIGMCQSYMSLLKQCEMDNAHLYNKAPQF